MKIFHLPDLGEGLAEAEIHDWFIKEGDEVKVDQPIVSMETAKAVVEVPAPRAGKIIKLFGKKGDIIPTGAPLIEFETGELETKLPPHMRRNASSQSGSQQRSNASQQKSSENKSAPNLSQQKSSQGHANSSANTIKDKGTVVGNLEESTCVLDEGDMIIGAAKTKANPVSATIRAMPAVRTLAKELNVDLQFISGSGPHGQITAEDVKNYYHRQIQSSPSALFDKSKIAPSSVEKLHGVRRAMAIAMTHSHQEIVPVTIVDDADISKIAEKGDITVAILQAMVSAIKTQPSLNAWYDGKTMERCLHQDIHIGLAMDTDDGLFVPVIKNVNDKNPAELRNEINQYKKSVRDRSVPPSNLQGATITLSNFGMFAGRYANPIIVPPQVAILGCGKLREEPYVNQGKIEIRKVLPLSLTFDHRAVTGGEATRFLGELIRFLKEQ